MAYDFTFPLKSGNSASTYYAQIVRTTDGYFWDTSTSLMAAAPTFGNTALTVTEFAGSGVLGLAAPATLPSGFYRCMLRLRSGGSPAAADNIVESIEFQKSGGCISR